MSLTIDDRKFSVALANSGLTIGATAQAVGKVAHGLGVDVTEIIETK